MSIKRDKNKPDFSQIPPVALLELAKASTYGNIKYKRGGYLHGIEWSRTYSATLRHLLAFWDGEDIDSESNLLHLSHALWNVMALVNLYYYYPKNDDRRIKLKKGERDEEK